VIEKIKATRWDRITGLLVASLVRNLRSTQSCHLFPKPCLLSESCFLRPRNRTNDTEAMNLIAGFPKVVHYTLVHFHLRHPLISLHVTAFLPHGSHRSSWISNESPSDLWKTRGMNLRGTGGRGWGDSCYEEGNTALYRWMMMYISGISEWMRWKRYSVIEMGKFPAIWQSRATFLANNGRTNLPSRGQAVWRQHRVRTLGAQRFSQKLKPP